MSAFNTATIDQYASAKEKRRNAFIVRLSKLNPIEIQQSINQTHESARLLPKKDAFKAEELHNFANDAENYFYLILNPAMAFGENLNHAIKRGYPIPESAAA